MERRKFIKSACYTCAGSIGLTLFLQACVSQKHTINYQLLQGKITVKKEEFNFFKNEKQIQRKFIVIKPERLDYPLVVYRISETEYRSLSLKCTHQGCELTPYDTAMVCPCHGAEFNNKGEVTAGPADTNLKLFNTTHDNDNIYIQF